MRNRIRRSALVVLLGLTVLGCEESRVDLTTFSEAVGVETRQLILALRNVGAAAEVAESVPSDQSLFSTPTTRVRVNGADVFVFEFGSVAETDAAVARLPAILAVTTFPVGPHFYRGNRIIVLYVGTDAAMTSLLERLLGRPIA
jgi:hypothetical protein